MTKKYSKKIFYGAFIAVAATVGSIWTAQQTFLEASSHREAPLITEDPLADITDLYAFRSPADPTKITLIANFIPGELPQAGPNYYNFGENIRYEFHIKNNAATTTDDITYRFTFTQTNQDPTTFFNIRLGQQNLKTTYTAEKSVAGGAFTTIVTNGIVPPNNIGPRSINSPVGLNTPNYNTLMTSAISTATGSGGETIFCGPVDDPFFVDLGGIFDLANMRSGTAARDGLARKNVHTIAMHIPIATLQKTGKTVAQAVNILDPDFVIGVWASTSRPQIRTLNTNGTETTSGSFVQVSRLGMPLTNEVIIPIGNKDKYNALTPYTEDPAFEAYYTNPELALYMDDRPAPTAFGTAVPGLAPLRIQTNSLQSFDFRNGQAGLSALKNTAAVTGTALAPGPSGGGAGFGDILLQAGEPRSVDILPIFYTGVPNLRPYQLATGKPARQPLAAGKPFIHNFLPVLGDMLRLNMAVPVTDRTSPDFSSEGLLAAAVLGLTDPRFNANANLQAIPNMDGFPNGRRLEDDVVRIELQAVSGVVLAAIGLWYDDYTATATNPVTPQLGNVLTFTAGPTANDTTLKTAFPYLQTPWRGFDRGERVTGGGPTGIAEGLNLSTPAFFFAQNYPNPIINSTTFGYRIVKGETVSLNIYDLTGKKVATVINAKDQKPGSYELKWKPTRMKPGIYIANFTTNSGLMKSIRISYQPD